jgi:hypothetical protein
VEWRAIGYILDFAVALDERSVRVHLQDLIGERTVGTVLGGGGHDDGDVEDLAQSGVGEDVVVVELGVPVIGEVEEADLEVEDDENLGESEYCCLGSPF